MADKSGIYSLGGFAYQILVLALYIPKMQAGDYVSFETIDDVETSLKQEDLDDIDNLLNEVRTNKRVSIQAKKTDISDAKAKKIVKNWMLSEIENNNVDKYLLVTDRKDVDENIIKNVSESIVADEIVKANERATSINMRLQEYKFTKKALAQLCTKVKNKSDFMLIDNIEDDIYKAYDGFFISTSVYRITYVERIRQFLSAIAFEILKCVLAGDSYVLKYEDVGKLQNQIIISITDEHFEPSYSQFKKLNKINLADLEISNSREYKQLCECDLDEEAIKRHLIYGEYYTNCRFGYYEAGKQVLVDDIETTAYENFCDAKDKLQHSNADTPRNRLDNTKSLPNDYARNERIKYGACISLTKDNVDSDLQISWKD